MLEGLLPDHVIDRHLSGWLSYLWSVSLSELLLLTLPEPKGPLLRVDGWFGLFWLEKVVFFSRPASASVSLHRLVVVERLWGPYIWMSLCTPSHCVTIYEVDTYHMGLSGDCVRCVRGHLVCLCSLVKLVCGVLLCLYDAYDVLVPGHHVVRWGLCITVPVLFLPRYTFCRATYFKSRDAVSLVDYGRWGGLW